MRTRTPRILLVGGGHAHIEVLRRFALAPPAGAALALVSPEASLTYSGMLPGVIAGHYTAAQAQVPLAPLAAAAGARFLQDRVVALDLPARTVLTANGHTEPFDLLSLDVGSVPDATPAGARDHAVPVKPVERLVSAWWRMLEDVGAGSVRTLAVVGGGAGGVEIALAMQHRTGVLFGADAPRIALFTDQTHLLPQHAAAVRHRLGRTLVARAVVLHIASPVTAVDAGAVVVADGRRVAADRVVWATSAASPPFLAAAGLACDARGFVAVDATLRSTSHPFVFAVGDCATQAAHPRPKSGVYAVRQGPPLARNLRRALAGDALVPYTPQRDALALITTGDRHAIASRGRFIAEGDWVWWWKDWIDRRFVARYASNRLPPPRAAAEAPG